jgi:hypothetical protein
MSYPSSAAANDPDQEEPWSTPDGYPGIENDTAGALMKICPAFIGECDPQLKVQVIARYSRPPSVGEMGYIFLSSGLRFSKDNLC